MEELEQEPEELPMEEVLAEIRQMLSAEVHENKEERKEPVFTMPKTDPIFHKTEERVSPRIVSQPIKINKPEIFVLTPSMRCDIPVAKALSQNVQKQTQRVLDKLQKDTNPEPQLTPELMAWLNSNLPSLIEKTVKERFS